LRATETTKHRTASETRDVAYTPDFFAHLHPQTDQYLVGIFEGAERRTANPAIMVEVEFTLGVSGKNQLDSERLGREKPTALLIQTRLGKFGRRTERKKAKKKKKTPNYRIDSGTRT